MVPPATDSRLGAAGDQDPNPNPLDLIAVWAARATFELHDAAAFAHRAGEWRTAHLLEHLAACWADSTLRLRAELPSLEVER